MSSKLSTFSCYKAPCIHVETIQWHSSRFLWHPPMNSLFNPQSINQWVSLCYSSDPFKKSTFLYILKRFSLSRQFNVKNTNIIYIFSQTDPLHFTPVDLTCSLNIPYNMWIHNHFTWCTVLKCNHAWPSLAALCVCCVHLVKLVKYIK